MNSLTIHGRLTRDPEFSTYTTSKGEEGKRCSFTVAVDRSRGEETDFFKVVCFGKRAEVIKKFFFKGSEILVRGEMQGNSYEDRDSVKRKSWNLVMDDFDFCGKKSDNAPAGGGAAAEAPADSFEEIDEDVPF